MAEKADTQEKVNGENQMLSAVVLMMGEMAAMRKEISELRTAKPTSTRTGLGGRRVAKPVLDTKTGKVYHAESTAGMAVATEYGLSATKPDGTKNSFVWYQIPDRDKRFKSITSQEYQETLAKQNQPTAQPAAQSTGKGK